MKPKVISDTDWGASIYNAKENDRINAAYALAISNNSGDINRNIKDIINSKAKGSTAELVKLFGFLGGLTIEENFPTTNLVEENREELKRATIFEDKGKQTEESRGLFVESYFDEIPEAAVVHTSRSARLADIKGKQIGVAESGQIFYEEYSTLGDIRLMPDYTSRDNTGMIINFGGNAAYSIRSEITVNNKDVPFDLKTEAARLECQFDFEDVSSFDPNQEIETKIRNLQMQKTFLSLDVNSKNKSQKIDNEIEVLQSKILNKKKLRKNDQITFSSNKGIESTKYIRKLLKEYSSALTTSSVLLDTQDQNTLQCLLNQVEEIEKDFKNLSKGEIITLERRIREEKILLKEKIRQNRRTESLFLFTGKGKTYNTLFYNNNNKEEMQKIHTAITTNKKGNPYESAGEAAEVVKERARNIRDKGAKILIFIPQNDKEVAEEEARRNLIPDTPHSIQMRMRELASGSPSKFLIPLCS